MKNNTKILVVKNVNWIEKYISLENYNLTKNQISSLMVLGIT